MRQKTFSSIGFEVHHKPTRRERFLGEMDAVVPWSSLCALIEPHYPSGERGRPPIGIERMLRIYFLQQWFNMSDPQAEDCLYDSVAMRNFVGIDLGRESAPDETTICKFRHLIEENGLGHVMLAAVNDHLKVNGFKVGTGTIMDATLISAPSSTRNGKGERDPEMHQTKKGNNWHFGMKAHIGTDADSGLVHTVIGTAANVSDVTVGNDLLHGSEKYVFADAGYQGADKRPEAEGSKAQWHVAMKPSVRRKWKRTPRIGWMIELAERHKASVRAKVEHPFRVVKRQFGYAKVRYRGLMKNTAQLMTMFALSNLWMARHRLLRMAG